MRLTLTALGAALALTTLAPAAAAAQTTTVAAPIGVQHLSLPAPDGRAIDVSVWPAAEERGVVVFSHGLNGSPEPYRRILEAWSAHGFTVLAPLHVDSLKHPDHQRYDNRAAFGARIADLAVVRGYAGGAHAGKPLIAAGHSFGSLMSLISAGAVTAAGPMGDPTVRGVIAFSSAGDLPGLVTTTTYATLSGPVLMITGEADVVPGYVTNWTQHRGPFDRSPEGDKFLMVFKSADHDLAGRADDVEFALIEQATEAFLDAYAIGDAGARSRLGGLALPEGVVLERR